MTSRAWQLLIVGILVGFLVAGRSTVCAQASNGQIEGIVVDQNDAAIAKASLTVTNVETGSIRTVTTDERLRRETTYNAQLSKLIQIP